MDSAPSRLKEFLAALCDPLRPTIPASDVVVVVAHPDDETIGCGALLARLVGPRVIVATDGAPLDGTDARAKGFADRTSYAAERAAELAQALDVAGVAPERVTKLNIADQQAARHLAEVTVSLARFFERHGTAVVLTHAYEGGHPDHDAAAFCVHEAARRPGQSIAIVEMPFYRAGERAEERQSFPTDHGVLRVLLTEKERETKRRMIGAHRTQKDVLSAFSISSEQFRVAPSYDFSQPPNGGRVLYDARSWGITSSDWLACAASVRAGSAVPS